MCNLSGLFCFEKAKEEKRKEMLSIAKRLLLENQSYNKDATGIALIDTYKNKVFIIKEGIEAEKFIPKLSDDLSKKQFNLILLHNRLKTNGSALDNKNNHPFKTKKSVLIHNGIISEFEKMIKRHKLKPKTECDSEVIQLIYEKKGDIKKTIKTFKESIFLNFALYDRNKNSLYLYRDSRLTFSKLPNKNLFIFSSEDDIQGLFVNAKKGEIFIRNQEIIASENDISDNLLYTIDFNNSFISKNKCSLKPIYVAPYIPKNNCNWQNNQINQITQEERETNQIDDYIENHQTKFNH